MGNCILYHRILVTVPLRGELACATILAIVASVIVSFVIGKPFGKHAIIESLAAGFMGGLMGPMLGEMLRANEIVFLLISLNIIYLVAVYGSLHVLTKEYSEQQSKKIDKKKPAAIFFTIVLPAIMIVMTVMVEIDSSINIDPVIVDGHHDHSGH
ncbi:hypothetical protein JCM9140_4485 [Halalkalibacter wakoensis JCM 9140]|uniref:Uncharacterized protein n=1 Tax=Halalkalibacter wakoensis JCM 9140 TaxID=1236970 RepID=W4Q875_9BACI|nr:hypothetical protein JCM9140_4485 [Halalkalibacter wakoensis JCM 9140]